MTTSLNCSDSPNRCRLGALRLPAAAISKMEIVRFVGESACPQTRIVMVTSLVAHG